MKVLQKMDYILGYREVIPDQTLPDKWKEIVVNSGSSQSALQDIKVPEKIGGYSYKDSSKYSTRNRFIYWRISHDVLELMEYSLDINLVNSRIRYKFTDTPILDGISIHETANSVIILIVTVSSIHKISFAHPHKIHKQDEIVVTYVDFCVQSIFSEVSIQNPADSHIFHIIPTSGSIHPPVAHAASSWLEMPKEEALFVLAYNSGIILLLRLDSVTGLVHSKELKQELPVPRFLSGLATAFRGRIADTEIAMSLDMYSLNGDIYLFALCREGNLRMWSCNKLQCVAEIELGINSNNTLHTFQNHGIIKSINYDNELYLGVYLKLNRGCEFSILTVLQESGINKLIRISTFCAPNEQLVDFSFTKDRLWAVWKTSDIDTVSVTHIKLPHKNEHFNSEWESAILTQLSEKDDTIGDSSTDPRQAYINYIFHPGKFSLIDITRALNIYRKSSYIADLNVSFDNIKEKVCTAVEAEIQSEVMDYELMDEEYLEIVNRCWSKFYSCVLQYHLNGVRPVGLLLLSNVCGIILLKKSSISLLRPMEAMEHLMLCNEKSEVSQFQTMPIFCQDISISQDLITLMSALVFLERQLSDDLKSLFEKGLHSQKSPDVIVENLCTLMIDTDDLFSDFDFQSELYHRLESIKDIAGAIAMLLELLTYDFEQPDNIELCQTYEKTSDILFNFHNMFGSHIGVSALSESVSQMTTIRFCICRNLIFLQHIAMSRPELFSSQVLHIMKSSLSPRTVILTQAYYIIIWICKSRSSLRSSQTLLDTSHQRLSMLKLCTNNTVFGLRQNKPCSLLELFVQYATKTFACKLINYKYTDSPNFIFWHFGMLFYVNIIVQLIWPISSNFIFPEWLLSTCQFLIIQEYVKLLNTWCEWNAASRKFILGVSLLEMGESRKACDYFLRASNGILIDPYLSNIILSKNNVTERTALVLYYLKVIEILEHHNASDCIIDLAIIALTIANKDNVNLPTLHSIIFSQHLSLQHHIDAYNCLNTNPDANRRVDCLRQLVVVLFKRKKLNDLISFPYVNMYLDLEKIIESRARSVDLIDNNYYDFLYSFHINNGNVRKAASIMYEHAVRLGQENQSLTILTKQTQCLLSCLNLLYLVNETYRWIIRPIISSTVHQQEEKIINHDEIFQNKVKQKIIVLEIQDIKREYILAEAKLKLVKHNTETSAVIESCPEEIIASVSSLGLHTVALDICEHFKLSKIPVLESLASQCIRLSCRDEKIEYIHLNTNNLFDMSTSTLTKLDSSWKLLEFLTLTQEKIEESEIHKGVARTLFHHNMFLPEWLFSSYTKRNAPELLRLMLQMGRLEEAANFSMKYIQAILGKGKEYFSFSESLPTMLNSSYVPFNILEILILELKYASNEDNFYSEVHEKLQKTFYGCLKSLERESSNRIHIKKIE